MDKWRLKEFMAMYDLEPATQDIIVEGVADARVVREFCRSHSLRAKVVEVWSIDIPDDLIQSYDCQSSNRQRVIAVCSEIAARVKNAMSQVRGIIDADLAYLLEEHLPGGLVLVTDGTSIEMYAYPYLQQYLGLYLHKFPVSADLLKPSLENVLISLACFRASSRLLGLGLEWPNKWDGCISFDGSEVCLNVDAFLDKYLRSRKDRESRAVFEETASHLRARIPKEARKAIYGIDYVSVVAFVSRKYIPTSSHRSVELIHRVLLTYIRMDECAVEPMFCELLRVFGK